MSNTIRSKFKSIDDLMIYVISENKHATSDNVYEYLEHENFFQIRDILMTKDNKPSVYDLGIIREINTDYPSVLNSNREWNLIAKDILKLYSERK